MQEKAQAFAPVTSESSTNSLTLVEPRSEAALAAAPVRGTRICVVGSLMGRLPGWVTTQGEILADLLKDAGHPVIAVSSKPTRVQRMLEIAWTLFRRRREIDVQCLNIYSGLSFVMEDVASWISRRLGHRVLMHLHGGGLPEFCAKHPRWTRRVFSRADAFVAPSHFLARALESLGFRVQVIPNVIDLSRYPYRHRRQLRPRLFWMRTFHPVWNPMMALDVLKRLRVKFPDATLAMCGQDKGQLAECKARAREMGLGNAVQFPGFLDMAAKARQGGAADIFINTNRVDNMPVAVVEAAAMGLPVVTTNVGGIPDLLRDGETGLLVPSEDDAAMAAAIERLLTDHDLAGRLSANGRKLAEQSAWENVHPQWAELFQKLKS